MAIAHCPGQDTRFWKLDDIFEIECPKCSASIEFFKDDPRRRCHSCGDVVPNPKIQLGCAEWCQYAKQCLGIDELPTGEASLCDALIEDMKGVFEDDDRRIRHALAVLDNAEQLLEAEDADPLVVMAAAILHDIGIREAERKHGSAAGKYQELEGPPIAERILAQHDVAPERIDHICRIIANHHRADGIDTPEFHIIWDADWLVNLADEGMAPDKLRKIIDSTFRTKTGRRIAAVQLLRQGEGVAVPPEPA